MYQEAISRTTPLLETQLSHTEEVLAHQLTSAFLFRITSAINHLQEQAQRLRQPEFNLWSSKSYFQEQHLSLADLRTFLDEYVGMFPIKQYPYTPFGIPSGTAPENQILTSQRSHNHKQELVAAGLETTRADLETWVAQAIEHWMLDETQPVGSKVVSISPRGSIREGYPGEKQTNYVFVNVYEKTNADDQEATHQLTQFISFDTNHQLQALLNQLQTEVGAQPLTSLPLPAQPEKPAHTLIAQLLVLHPAVTLESLKHAIQQHADSWPIKLTDLPVLPVLEFYEQQQKVIDYCQHQFSQLLLKHQDGGHELASQEFDALVATVRTWFLKWVETHATNYQVANPTLFISPDALIEVIDESWKLSLKEQAQLSHEEHSRLQQLKQQAKLSSLTPLLRLSSVAHCIVGTPGSLAFRAVNLSQLTQLHSPSLLTKNLTLEQHQELTHFMQQMTKISVYNQTTGATETYYLQLTDPQYAHDYEHGCYKKIIDGQEVLFGPCDVALTDDGLIVPHSVMTEAEYLQLQTALAQQHFTDTKEQLLANEALSTADKEMVELIFNRLSTRLFSTSFSNFVAGVTDCNILELTTLPPDFWQTLAASVNPLPLLRQLLLQLDATELLELEEIAIYRSDPNSPHSLSSPKDSIIGHHGRRPSSTSRRDNHPTDLSDAD